MLVNTKDVEEKLGLKLEYDEWTENIPPNDWNNFMGDSVKHSDLSQRSKDEIKKLLIELLNKGDIEKANLCGLILKSGEMQDYVYKEVKFDKEESEQLRNAESEYISTLLAEIEQLEEISSIDDIEEQLKKISLSENACRHIDDETKKRIGDKRKELTIILQQKVKNRINSLDGQMTEVKEHLEFPENEDKLEELQEQVEGLEEKYFGNNINDSHKVKRIAEQGVDISEIMQSISEYKLYGRSYIDDENFSRLNAQVVKKTEFLEGKLAFLKDYKDIPGNAERIAELESQIETMQDSWIVAQKGYNNIDEILQTAENRKREIQNRLVQAQKEIETINPMSWEYIQKTNQIENLTKQVTKYEKYIEKMQQTKTEIESGENPSFMGKHHRDRLQREEQERVENNRGKIQELEGKIAELQQHIEIPENEQIIIDLQTKIDEIEATIPSDRGKHKRAREAEQGLPKEDILKSIDEVIKSDQSPYVTDKAERTEQKINTRVAFLTQKLEYLQQHLDIEGNDKRIANIQNEIEQLEDKWELCIHGFGSKEQVDRRLRMSERYLNTDLLGVKTRNIELTKEKVQEYWEKIQNGKEVPELFGQHHRERIVREKEAEKNMLEQEYGLTGIEDVQTLQQRLEDIVSKGISLGADKTSEKKVAEFEKMKQAIPRFEEFKNVYLELRETGNEYKLYENMDFQNVSFDCLLERARKILEEKAKFDVEKTNLEQEEVITEKQPEVITNSEQVMEETIEKESSVVEEPKEDKEDSITMETNIEIDSASMMEAHFEYMKNHQDPQSSQVLEDYWNEIHSQQLAEVQEPNQAMPSVDLWMNRFKRWNGAIDRVLQSVKGKFVEMKSKIIAAINEKLKERISTREGNAQEQEQMKGGNSFETRI